MRWPIRIISKTGPLYNYADRDHCLQYMFAIGLIHGTLTADHYTDQSAKDPRIDQLRKKMEVVEDKRYSREYHDPDKRSIANAIQIFFGDGTKTDKVEVEYPIGHRRRRRRKEGIPVLIDKFIASLGAKLSPAQTQKILELCNDRQRLEATPVTTFMEMFVVE